MAEIVMVFGGPGAGKSSICRALCERRERALHIEVDRIRESMLSGFLMPDPEGDPQGAWTRQFELARTSVAFMADAYANDGIDVVIDDTNIPTNFREHYGSLFDDSRVTAVFVSPGVAEQVRRMRRRKGPFDDVLIAAISTPFYEALQAGVDTTDWVRLDDPDATVESNVDVIVRALTDLRSL